MASELQMNVELQKIQEQLRFYQESISIFQRLVIEYAKAKDAVTTLGKANIGQEMLVPLTSTLYVPGKLLDNKKLCVGLGTGYYADMTIEQVNGFINRKLNLLNEKINDLRSMVLRLRNQHLETGELSQQMGDVAAVSTRKKR